MKKTFAVTAALTLALGLAVAGTSIAADPGPADMVLKTAEGKKPAKFSHKKHQDSYKCGDCHHGATDGKQVPYTEDQAVQKCAACHNDTMANPKLNSYMKAAHENCKGCHKTESEKGKPAPTKCNDCHIEGAK